MTTMIMNTTVKEMSFNELNTQIDDLKKRIEELVSERETRKEEAINNWKRHMELVMRDTKILMEMGIDPHSLSPITDVDLVDKDAPDEEPQIENSPADCDGKEIISEISANNETFVDEDKKEVVVKDNPALKINSVAHIDKVEEYEEKQTIAEQPPVEVYDEDDEHNNPLLTPFYKMWKIKSVKRVESTRTSKIDTNINPFTGKKMTVKTRMPFYKLYSDKPIRGNLKLGNLQYKKCYPDPEETRVVSADGYAPTLTYTHSDFLIWIGPKYDENGNLIAETSGSEIGKAA